MTQKNTQLFHTLSEMENANMRGGGWQGRQLIYIVNILMYVCLERGDTIGGEER